MNILWRVRKDNNVVRARQLLSEDYGEATNFRRYYEYTIAADKFVVIQIEHNFLVIDNSKMYDCYGDFIDELNLEEHQKFSTEEEALMYATSCI